MFEPGSLIKRSSKFQTHLVPSQSPRKTFPYRGGRSRYGRRLGQLLVTEPRPLIPQRGGSEPFSAGRRRTSRRGFGKGDLGSHRLLSSPLHPSPRMELPLHQVSSSAPELRERVQFTRSHPLRPPVPSGSTSVARRTRSQARLRNVQTSSQIALPRRPAFSNTIQTSASGCLTRNRRLYIEPSI